MVDSSYLAGRAPPPSPLMTFIDQTVVPNAIDAAGSIEVALNQVVMAARRRPLTALTVAIGVGCGLALALRR